MPIGIVLAGGASSRFGSDKLAALLDGRPLLEHAVERVASVTGEVVVVLAPAASEPWLGRSESRVRFAHDASAHQGPLAGLVAGLEAVDGEAEGDGGDGIALVTAGDMPRIESRVLALLAATLADDPGASVVVLEADPPAPLPMALRTVPALAAARSLLARDRRSLRALLDVLPVGMLSAASWHPLDPTLRSLRDVDVPSDL